MHEEETVKKIEELIRSLFSQKKFAEEIRYLQQSLNVSQKQLVAAWLLWDAKIQTYSNEVYSSVALRLAIHAHNYLKGSWHEKRQNAVLNLLEKIQARRICDIGFGTPQKYVKEFLGSDSAQILLADFDPSSLLFAEKVLGYWNPKWNENIEMRIFDINHAVLPRGYDTYIFQDSIEHADDPSAALRRFVASMPNETRIIFSLPIEVEHPIPEHHICWKDEHEIFGWLEVAGLSVTSYEIIQMNKDVDIFSLSLHPNFKEIVILARKP